MSRDLRATRKACTIGRPYTPRGSRPMDYRSRPTILVQFQIIAGLCRDLRGATHLTVRGLVVLVDPVEQAHDGGEHGQGVRGDNADHSQRPDDLDDTTRKHR